MIGFGQMAGVAIFSHHFVAQVNEWLAVCLKFEDTLDKKDPVLVQWATRLQVFKSGMPLLLQLSSKYLKVHNNYVCTSHLLILLNIRTNHTSKMHYFPPSALPLDHNICSTG